MDEGLMLFFSTLVRRCRQAVMMGCVHLSLVFLFLIDSVLPSVSMRLTTAETYIHEPSFPLEQSLKLSPSGLHGHIMGSMEKGLS